MTQVGIQTQFVFRRGGKALILYSLGIHISTLKKYGLDTGKTKLKNKLGYEEYIWTPEEFLKEKKNLEDIGYEVVGTKYDSKTMFLLVRKKEK